MNKKVLIAIVVLVIVIAGALFWMLRQDPNTNSATNNSTDTTGTNQTDATPTESTGQQATITYSDSGYSPSSITVKAGDTVVIKNDSSKQMQFDSDPHPVHTNNPELNVGSVPPGESMSFVVDTKGTFGYHNHLNASQKGTIIVE